MATLTRTFPVRAVARSSSVLSRILDADALWRERRALGQLPDSILKDVGLTRDQAEAEAKRPIWDAPLHWRR